MVKILKVRMIEGTFSMCENVYNKNIILAACLCADILPRFSWLYVRVASVIKHFIRKRIWEEIEMKDIWDINTQMVTSLICRKLRFWPLSLGLFLCFKMKKLLYYLEMKAMILSILTYYEPLQSSLFYRFI